MISCEIFDCSRTADVRESSASVMDKSEFLPQSGSVMRDISRAVLDHIRA